MCRALGMGAAFLTAVLGMASAIGPLQRDAKSSPPLSQEAAQRLATDLLTFLREVETQYVREVSSVDLAFASISGLYRAAHTTAPADLREQLQSLYKNRDTFHEKCIALVTRLRMNIGDLPELREGHDVIAIADGLGKVLDPYCGFTNPQEFTRGEEGELSSGIQFHEVPRPNGMQSSEPPFGLPRSLLQRRVPATLVVKSVVPGSPAQKSGIRPGDVVFRIDNRPCGELSWPQIFGTFFPECAPSRGNDPYREHRLEFRRSGIDKPRVAEVRAVDGLTAESVFGVKRNADGAWNHLISASDRLCYARIGPISLTTHNEIQLLLADIAIAGHQGLILDLRWCPGGYLTPSQAVARSFLNHDEPIAKIQYRRTGSVAAPERPVVRFPDLPVLVLINGETMGGGEFIAAALQDYGRATIAGERTFGKASVQNPLENNPWQIPYRITSGEFLTSKSKRLDRHLSGNDEWGVRPDAGRWLPSSPAVSKQLKEWWTWHVLRPVGSRDALPTDDPDVDAQLTAALQMLRQMTSKAKS